MVRKVYIGFETAPPKLYAVNTVNRVVGDCAQFEHQFYNLINRNPPFTEHFAYDDVRLMVRHQDLIVLYDLESLLLPRTTIWSPGTK